MLTRAIPLSCLTQYPNAKLTVTVDNVAMSESKKRKLLDSTVDVQMTVVGATKVRHLSATSRFPLMMILFFLSVLLLFAALKSLPVRPQAWPVKGGGVSNHQVT